MKKEKGITLIALIVSIIVLLILAGVGMLALFGENGMITRAKEAKFKAEFKAYQEKVNLYTTAERLNGVDSNSINAGDEAEEPKIDIKKIIPDLKKEYIKKVEVAKGEMYYVPKDIKKKQIKQEVKWCFEIGIKVKGYLSYEDFLNGTEGVKVSDGSYTAVGGVYCNSPDLTGFNYKNTYYVYWDENGQEIIGDTIDKEVPQNWYNYKEKKWANVVTINGDKMSYFVWIPRYSYKINKDSQSVDVKFIDKNNFYKDFDTGQTDQYSETVPIYGENSEQTNYIVPQEFWWDTSDTGGEIKQLAGYWVSKYEVSTTDTGIDYNLIIDQNKIAIEKMKSKNISATLNYEIYLDGELKFKGNAITFPYEFTGLETNSEHVIKIIAKDQGGRNISIREMKTKTLEEDLTSITKPDLTGFNPQTTFYVTYDANGKEIASVPITEVPPDGWYDYTQKKWANIVTINGDKMSYFVWIPRYEYRTKPILQEAEIRFIKTSQTTPTEGYIIPDEFRWNQQDTGKGIKELPGYWVSKYEVSTSDTGIDYNLIIDKTKITIEKMKSKNISATLTYELYLDGVLKATELNLPYEITGLQANSEHIIKIIAKDNGGRNMSVREMKTKTLEEDLNTITTPDLTGFNPSNTYYVTYDSSGNENSSIPISQTPPNGWYDYAQKKWANIATKNGDKMAYFVWIPRYEYQTKPVLQETEIRFIKTSQTTPTEGYIIPDEFRWNQQDTGAGIKELAGYWVSKYEVSQ